MRGVRLLAAMALIAATAPAPAQETAQEKLQVQAWIAHCVSQISETNKSRARTYCLCMAESVDTSEKMRQTDLERSFPPAHQDCFRKAGFRIPN